MTDRKWQYSRGWWCHAVLWLVWPGLTPASPLRFLPLSVSPLFSQGDDDDVTMNWPIREPEGRAEGGSRSRRMLLQGGRRKRRRWRRGGGWGGCGETSWAEERSSRKSQGGKRAKRRRGGGGGGVGGAAAAAEERLHHLHHRHHLHTLLSWTNTNQRDQQAWICSHSCHLLEPRCVCVSVCLSVMYMCVCVYVSEREKEREGLGVFRMRQHQHQLSNTLCVCVCVWEDVVVRMTTVCLSVCICVCLLGRVEPYMSLVSIILEPVVSDMKPRPWSWWVRTPGVWRWCCSCLWFGLSWDLTTPGFSRTQAWFQGQNQTWGGL